MVSTGPVGVPPTAFERRLHDAITVAWAAPSGTVWRNAASIVETELGWPVGTVGLISVTDSGVKNNRPLSAGLITQPRQLLIIPVADEVGLDTEEGAVIDLIPKTRHLTTVGLASLVSAQPDGSDKVWRVQRIVEVDGLGVANEVVGLFPLVPSVNVRPLVPFGNAPAEEPAEPWSVVVSPGSRSLEVPTGPAGGFATELRPGDRVLLSNETHTVAHSAAVVSLVRLTPSTITIAFDPVVQFAAPEEFSRQP
jgi:hypothetical protein